MLAGKTNAKESKILVEGGGRVTIRREVMQESQAEIIVDGDKFYHDCLRDLAKQAPEIVQVVADNGNDSIIATVGEKFEINLHPGSSDMTFMAIK
ncbi:MAG: hypothetical protein IJ188_06540 [Clostridia bacterium]|nr:hypothetical protein [Clostridia bacterium]